MDKEPTHKPDKEALADNASNQNNITGNPDSDGVGDLQPVRRNELSLSEAEMEIGLGLSPFERPTPVEEAHIDHPNYLSTSDDPKGRE
jgi:hypothetical protein